jgi:hypothetical protein
VSAADDNHSGRDFWLISGRLSTWMLHRFTPASLNMKGVVNRIGLFFRVGWQWLSAAPRYRGTLLCGLSVVGAIIAIGYNGSKGIFGRSTPVTQTSDVVAARISAMSGGSVARDAEVVEPSPVDDNSQSGKAGPSARAMASDKSFLVADTENKKVATQDKKEVKKPAKKSAKKPQRRVSGDKDRKFNPPREIKRTGEDITRVLRDLF